MGFVEPIVIGCRTYTDIVPKNYEMNPETEDLIYGDELEDAMTVLVAQKHERHDEKHNEKYIQDIAVDNRWCVVSKLRCQDNQIIFIGLYADGQKAIRMTGTTSGWLVKKESRPGDQDEEEAQRQLLSKFQF